VWAAAHLDATYDTKGLHFHISDPLGSRRVQTSAAAGLVEETCQSLPFGDVLDCYIPTSAPATADDATEHHFTGKERDTESGNDYFEARYYSSAMGRFMSPDWSAQEEPVPYAKLDNPQSLNLYSYVLNNPLGKADPDGHEWIDPSQLIQMAQDVVKSPYVQGGAQILVGGGLVVTAAGGDVPGGAVGALMVANATLGGTAVAVNGTTQIIGEATHTDTAAAREAVSATSTLPGLATAAATGGNLKAAAAVSTVTNAATLATSPKEAVRNPATTADAAQTVKETTGLVQGAINTVKSWFSPPPPPAPKPPPPPSCSVAGACSK
jgi:RHS repeat-associated protein